MHRNGSNHEDGIKGKVKDLENIRDRLRNLLEDPRRWNNECEEIFSKFRLTVMHLKNDKDALDTIKDKEVVWRFLLKLSRDRKAYWSRLEEVLHILKASDVWVKALIEDPEANMKDLPPNVLGEFESRGVEVASRWEKYVHIAIIGCGASAVRFCEWLARHNQRIRCNFFRIVALVDKNSDRIAALRRMPQANDLKLENADDFPGIEGLLGQVDFDAAILSTHTDRDRVLPALLARGKFALVEPPLATNAEAALRFSRLSKQPLGSKIHRLLVAELSEYAPEISTGGTHLCTIGDILGAEARAAWNGDEASQVFSEGIGCTMAMGLRWIRALRRLVGPVEEAIATSQVKSEASSGSQNPFGTSRKKAATGPETGTVSMLRHRGGVVSTLRLQMCGPRPQKGLPNIIVSGALGDLLIEESSARVKIETHSGSLRRKPPENQQTDKYLEDLSPGERILDIFAQQVMPVVRSAESTRGEAEVVQPAAVAKNLDEHLADLAVAEAILKSAKSRRFESVCNEGIRANELWD